MHRFYDYPVYGTLGFIIPTQPEWTTKDRNQNKENVLKKEMLMSWVTPSFSTYPVPAGKPLNRSKHASLEQLMNSQLDTS